MSECRRASAATGQFGGTATNEPDRGRSVKRSRGWSGRLPRPVPVVPDTHTRRTWPADRPATRTAGRHLPDYWWAGWYRACPGRLLGAAGIHQPRARRTITIAAAEGLGEMAGRAQRDPSGER